MCVPTPTKKSCVLNIRPPKRNTTPGESLILSVTNVKMEFFPTGTSEFSLIKVSSTGSSLPIRITLNTFMSTLVWGPILMTFTTVVFSALSLCYVTSRSIRSFTSSAKIQFVKTIK